jgi:hypothetical protein
MSTQTPRPPPAPVAAFLSPILWRMENPDRFDMWVGLLMRINAPDSLPAKPLLWEYCHA